MEFVSLLGTVVIVMLLIWLLPYLLWFFIIMGIVIWVAGFFTRRKIRKQQQSYFRQFQDQTNEQSSYFHYDDIERGSGSGDIIDVEYSEREES